MRQMSTLILVMAGSIGYMFGGDIGVAIGLLISSGLVFIVDVFV